MGDFGRKRTSVGTKGCVKNVTYVNVNLKGNIPDNKITMLRVEELRIRRYALSKRGG